MSMLKRLKELVEGHKENCGVFSASDIFSNDELEEIVCYLPKLLAVVEAAKLFADAEKGWGGVPTKLKLALNALES